MAPESSPESQDIEKQAPESNPAPVSSSPGNVHQGEVVDAQEVAEHVFQHMMEAHSGPLPSPRTYREYAAIIPNGDDRIMRMAEDEAVHRRDMERRASDRKDRAESRADWGVRYAFGLGVVGLLVGGGVAYSGHSIEGATIAGATLVSLVTAFIQGTSTAKQARQQEVQEALKRQDALPSGDDDDDENEPE